MPIVCSAGMTIIFIATECHPWCKTGGLGDVLGGLPPALAAMGHRVMTIVPRYDQYKDAWDTNVLVDVLSIAAKVFAAATAAERGGRRLQRCRR